MFDFRRKKGNVVTISEFIEVRSYYGAGIHILSAEVDEETVYDLNRNDIPAGRRATLCGYTSWVPTNTVIPVTSSLVLDTKNCQHAGWFWCPTCASIITNQPAEDFIEAYKKATQR